MCFLLLFQGDGHQALITLQKGVEEYFSDATRLRSDDTEEAKAHKFAHAKVCFIVMFDQHLFDV